MPSLCPICAETEAAEHESEQQLQRAALYLRRQKRAIPPLYLNASLDDLPEEIDQLIRNLPYHRGLYLWGGVGTGKTHTLAATGSYLITRGYAVLRVVWDDLCQKIRGTFTTGKSEWDIMYNMRTVEILIIEDLGTSVSQDRQESDFNLRTLLTIIDNRIEQRKPIFISSNKSLDELGRSFDKRVRSRIAGNCEIINCTGTDRRLNQENTQ